MKTTDENWCELMEKLHDVSKRVSRRPLYIGEMHGLLHDNLILCALFQNLPETGAGLVHYTSWENALNMFNEYGNPVMRMYNYEQSNDPDEGKIKPKEWEEVERNVDPIDKSQKDNDGRKNDFEYDRNTYGCSFSSGGKGVEDDLMYWRMYGNNGEGCSLKITPPSARKLTSPSTHKQDILRVCYRDKDSSDRCDQEEIEDGEIAVRLRKFFAVCTDIVSKTNGKYPIEAEFIVRRLREIVRGCYHLVKHKNYAVEREWRMIKVAPNSEAIRFDTTGGGLIRRYIEGPCLKEILSSASVITIGPTVPNGGAARAYIEYLAKTKHGIQHVEVKNSNQNYRRQL